MMGVSPIEYNGTMGRTLDFTSIKHNEDMKGQHDQQNIQVNVQEMENKNVSTVKGSEEARTDNESQGDGSGYSGDGGRYRKKNAFVPKEGRMIKKQPGHFDMSV